MRGNIPTCIPSHVFGGEGGGQGQAQFSQHVGPFGKGYGLGSRVLGVIRPNAGAMLVQGSRKQNSETAPPQGLAEARYLEVHGHL